MRHRYRYPLAGDGFYPAHLEAEWRTDDVGKRYHVGFSFLCPRHAGEHRLRIVVVNPFDGEDEFPWEGAVRAWVDFRDDDAKNIGAVTLTHPAGGDVLRFADCGPLRIVDGFVELILNGG